MPFPAGPPQATWRPRGPRGLWGVVPSKAAGKRTVVCSASSLSGKMGMWGADSPIERSGIVLPDLPGDSEGNWTICSPFSDLTFPVFLVAQTVKNPPAM